MMQMSEEMLELVNRIMERMPDKVLFTSTDENDAVRIKWRRRVLRVSTSGHVDEVEGSVMGGSDVADLVRHILFDDQPPL